MFATPTPFLGIRPNIPWASDFLAALTVPDTLAADTQDAALATCLDTWARASAGLAADAGYQASERYCIRQSFLWKIYSIFADRGLGEKAGPVIYERGLDVLAETAAAAQPEDQAFLQAAAPQTALLEHLQAVALYYAQALNPGMLDGLESFSAETPPPPIVPPLVLPPTSPGYLCTLVLKSDTNAELARQFWKLFMAQNTLVRLVTLGRDEQAREAAEIADPIFFSPGGAQKPGRCLWAQPANLLPEVHGWLRNQGFAQPETACCIFVRANGTLSAVLKKTDTIDDFAISDAFFNAS